ncbi:MAG: hemerythrin family protein [Treponema sp.]|nr:hemerythrin family protein [Treponema sp.]
MRIEFTQELVTGMPAVDEQHKELIRRINDIVLAGDASTGKEETDRLIDFLGDYIVEHFEDEEKLQRKSGYPKYEWHHGLHQEYIAEFRKMKEEYGRNGPSLSFTLALNNSIIGWIIRHIRTVDRELGEFINGSKVF